MPRSGVKTLLDLLRTLFVTTLKIVAIAIAFICKIVGMVLLKTGETIEKMLSRW
jgi:hypothetical protein